MLNQVTLDNLDEIAKKIKKYFTIGQIISINGPMGVGKTTLLKAVLCHHDVSSPSFLHALYYGDYMHIDAYTLTESKFLDLSIEDELDTKCVIVEWGDLFKELLEQFNKKIININLKYESKKHYIEIIE